jgi:hypothetical protein
MMAAQSMPVAEVPSVDSVLGKADCAQCFTRSDAQGPVYVDQMVHHAVNHALASGHTVKIEVSGGG